MWAEVVNRLLRSKEEGDQVSVEFLSEIIDGSRIEVYSVAKSPLISSLMKGQVPCEPNAQASLRVSRCSASGASARLLSFVSNVSASGVTGPSARLLSFVSNVSASGGVTGTSEPPFRVSNVSASGGMLNEQTLGGTSEPPLRVSNVSASGGMQYEQTLGESGVRCSLV